MVFNDDEYASFIIFDKLKQLQQENKQLKNNWNKIEIAAWDKSNYYCSKTIAAKVAANIMFVYRNI